MADYLVTDTELTSVADAIRTKGGTSASLSFPTGFVSAISAISGGLEYEEGTWTPTSDASSVTFPFTNSHSTAPALGIVVDATGTVVTTNYSPVLEISISFIRLFGVKVQTTGTNLYNESAYLWSWETNMIRKSEKTYDLGLSTTGYTPPKYNSSYYWRAGRTYKWIAIWI